MVSLAKLWSIFSVGKRKYWRKEQQRWFWILSTEKMYFTYWKWTSSIKIYNTRLLRIFNSTCRQVDHSVVPNSFLIEFILSPQNQFQAHSDFWLSVVCMFGFENGCVKFTSNLENDENETDFWARKIFLIGIFVPFDDEKMKGDHHREIFLGLQMLIKQVCVLILLRPFLILLRVLPVGLRQILKLLQFYLHEWILSIVVARNKSPI